MPTETILGASRRVALLDRRSSAAFGAGATLLTKLRVSGYHRIKGNLHVDAPPANGFPRVEQSVDGVTYSLVKVIDQDATQADFQFPFDIQIRQAYVRFRYEQGAGPSTFIFANVIVIPAGKEFSGALPDGGKGLTYTSRYNVVGANAFGAVGIIDGLNDQGLSIGLFYFPGYAQYTPATKENASRALAPQDFALWVLGNFATVDEVKRGVKDIVMVPTPFPGWRCTTRLIC